jgi:hypothetical protein
VPGEPASGGAVAETAVRARITISALTVPVDVMATQRSQLVLSVAVCSLFLVTAVPGGPVVDFHPEKPAGPESDAFREEFAVSIQKNAITSCGQVCREVNATATLRNVGNRTIRNFSVTVSLYTQIAYVEVLGHPIDWRHSIWSGTRQIGTLPPGAVYETTTEFGVTHGTMIKYGNDCRVNVEVRTRSARERHVYRGTKRVC